MIPIHPPMEPRKNAELLIANMPRPHHLSPEALEAAIVTYEDTHAVLTAALDKAIREAWVAYDNAIDRQMGIRMLAIDAAHEGGEDVISIDHMQDVWDKQVACIRMTRQVDLKAANDANTEGAVAALNVLMDVLEPGWRENRRKANKIPFWRR